MQEELGELTCTFMEVHGRERVSKPTQEELKKKFSGDIASLVGNSLTLAHHFNVDLETVLKEIFPI